MAISDEGVRVCHFEEVILRDLTQIEEQAAWGKSILGRRNKCEGSAADRWRCASQGQSCMYLSVAIECFALGKCYRLL